MHPQIKPIQYPNRKASAGNLSLIRNKNIITAIGAKKPKGKGGKLRASSPEITNIWVNSYLFIYILIKFEAMKFGW